MSRLCAFPCVLLLVVTSAWSQVFSVGFAPGERVPDVSFVDLGGSKSSLQRPGGKLGSVFITRDVECPVSQRYVPRVSELARQYRAMGYEFVMVDVTPHGVTDAKRAAAQLPGLRSVLDEDKAITRALRAESTAEAFLIDSAGTLRYRGAIDDQFGLDFHRPKTRSPWLRNAMDKVAVGEEPLIRRTSAHGCPLALNLKSQGTVLPITYHNRVSRIIQTNCQVCHRAGGLGPMPLENYRQVYERRAVIELMVKSGRMPPWSAQPGVGEWTNDRSLPVKDRADLQAWINAEAPEGDPRDAPVARRFASGWNIGKPDFVASIPHPFRVPAQGVVDYKNFYVKTNFAEDKWITAMEIKPTQPKAVHHALAYLEEPGRKPLTPGQLAKLRPGDSVRPLPNDGVRGFYAATVPGSLGIVYPEGTGKRLPRGAWLKIEIHYQPSGTEVLDRTQIGFRFSPKRLREVESLSAFNTDLVIPPNHPRYQMNAEYAFSNAGQLLSLFPHMHFRGSAFRYDLRYPDGRTVPLLHVPKFDFAWQSYYQFKSPVEVPAGSKLMATAWYDNSKNNPWNPDPSKTVRWGVATTDEMMIGYFDFVKNE